MDVVNLINDFEGFSIYKEFDPKLFAKRFNKLKRPSEFEYYFNIFEKQLRATDNKNYLLYHENGLSWTDALLKLCEKKLNSREEFDSFLEKFRSPYINEVYIQKKRIDYGQDKLEGFSRFDINQEYDPRLFTKTFGNVKEPREFVNHFSVFEQQLKASANSKSLEIYHKNGLVWTQAVLNLLKNRLTVSSRYDTFLKNLNSPFINDRYTKQKLDESVTHAPHKKEVEDTGVKKKIPLPVRREKKKQVVQVVGSTSHSEKSEKQDTKKNLSQIKSMTLSHSNEQQELTYAQLQFDNNVKFPNNARSVSAEKTIYATIRHTKDQPIKDQQKNYRKESERS